MKIELKLYYHIMSRMLLLCSSFLKAKPLYVLFTFGFKLRLWIQRERKSNFEIWYCFKIRLECLQFASGPGKVSACPNFNMTILRWQTTNWVFPGFGFNIGHWNRSRFHSFKVYSLDDFGIKRITNFQFWNTWLFDFSL